MVDVIRQFLRFPAGPAPGVGSAAVPEDVRLAACVLLLELAHADGELTDDERLHLLVERRGRRDDDTDAVTLQRSDIGIGCIWPDRRRL